MSDLTETSYVILKGRMIKKTPVKHPVRCPYAFIINKYAIKIGDYAIDYGKDGLWP